MRRLTNFVGGEFVAPMSVKYAQLISPVTEQPMAELPHGGFQRSGYRKDLSVYGFEDYAQSTHVMHSIEF